MSKNLRFDFYVVLGIVLLSIPTILHFEVKPLTASLYLFALPTLYLFVKRRKPYKELLLGTLLIGSGFGLIFDIIATVSGAWFIPDNQLVFNYRIFGFWPVDEIIWFFLWALFILAFYEHFYEKDRRDKLSKRFRYIAVPILISATLVLWVAVVDHSRLAINYAYSLILTPAIIPIWYVFSKRPNLIPKFLKTGAFFFLVFLAHELTALKLGQWQFLGTSQYIGWVELFGLRFPFEELLLWMGLSPFIVLAIYEGFVDNDK